MRNSLKGGMYPSKFNHINKNKKRALFKKKKKIVMPHGPFTKQKNKGE